MCRHPSNAQASTNSSRAMTPRTIFTARQNAQSDAEGTHSEGLPCFRDFSSSCSLCLLLHSELEVCKTASSCTCVSHIPSDTWRIALHKPRCMRICQLFGQSAVGVPIGRLPESCCSFRPRSRTQMVGGDGRAQTNDTLVTSSNRHEQSSKEACPQVTGARIHRA